MLSNSCIPYATKELKKNDEEHHINSLIPSGKLPHFDSDNWILNKPFAD